MNQTPTQRTIIFGTSLAAILVVTILVLTGGRQPVPAPLPAPAGEAALPMLDGVNHGTSPDQAPKTPTETTPETTPTPAKAEPKPASETPRNN